MAQANVLHMSVWVTKDYVNVTDVLQRKNVSSLCCSEEKTLWIKLYSIPLFLMVFQSDSFPKLANGAEVTMVSQACNVSNKLVSCTNSKVRVSQSFIFTNIRGYFHMAAEKISSCVIENSHTKKKTKNKTHFSTVTTKRRPQYFIKHFLPVNLLHCSNK